MFVNYFRATQTQHMLFWLLKDALLAFKRRPFGLQKMPFKAITNALLYYN